MSSERTAKIALFLGCALLLGAGVSAVSLRRSARETDNRFDRTVVLTYRFSIEEVPPDAREIRLWVPLPAEGEHQKLHDFRFEGAGIHQLVPDAAHGNRYLSVNFPAADLAGEAKSEFALTATVSRRAYRVWNEIPQAEELTARELRRFLVPNRLGPIDGFIAQEARQVAGHAASTLERARLLYDHVVDTLSYDKSGEGWGRGDALYACDIRKGNCTDFHSLFIAEARSLSIPARFVMGLPLGPDSSGGEVPGYHCWSEFYLKDVGWVPVDASEAQKHPEKQDYFFGGLDADRIAFTTGRDIVLPNAAGEPLNYFIYPYVEVDGAEHPFVESRFSFREVDRDGAETG